MPDVTIYTTASCPYCLWAKALLCEKNVAFTEIAVDGEPGARQEMTARAHGRKTVPQILDSRDDLISPALRARP